METRETKRSVPASQTEATTPSKLVPEPYKDITKILVFQHFMEEDSVLSYRDLELWAKKENYEPMKVKNAASSLVGDELLKFKKVGNHPH